MNILESAYKNALEEDAVMGVGDAAPIGAGDISTPTHTIDTSLMPTTDNHMSHDDILGKYDPTKGVFGNGDFNLPKNALGKGNILKRMGYPSKKRKGHKNPYLTGMTVISEIDVDVVIQYLGSKSSIIEGKEYTSTQILEMLKQLKQTFKNPADIDEFIHKHHVEIEHIDKSKKEYTVVSTAWNILKYAASNGFNFIKKHWWKILMCILIVVAIMWFGQIERGIQFGTTLFGKGLTFGSKIAKKLVKIISTSTPKDIEATTVLTNLRTAKSWIPAPESLLPTTTRVDAALDSAGQIFQVILNDGSFGYTFGNDTTVYIPQY